MFKKMIIVLVAVICISSGAFAMWSNHLMENVTDNIDNSANVNNDNNLVNDVKDVSSSKSSLNNIINDFVKLQHTYGYVADVDGELRHYINDKGAYYLESEGLADRYIQCVDCGGFIPIGPITNPLPEAAICHHNDMDKLGNISEYGDICVSRDKAYYHWALRGMPVCDDIHLEVDAKKEQYVVSYDYTRCNECHGFVPLNTNGHLPENALCHHYNGSLNVNEIPKNNIYEYGEAKIIFYNEDSALNEIISGSLNYDDYHIYGKYTTSYHAITYDDIVNYLEHNIKPEGSLSFDREKYLSNTSQEILDDSSNASNIGNDNSIIVYDEPIAIDDMNNPNQIYDSDVSNPTEPQSLDEPIAIVDMNEL